jgi:formyltetrahydrofolate deformylase
MDNQSAVLLVECADRPGLVHGITGVLLRAGANIVSNHEFVDGEHGQFYMRTAFEGPTDEASILSGALAALPAGATVTLRRPGMQRLVVLASHEHHCLADLLVRHAYRELGAEIVAVVSNHEGLSPLAEKFGVPFHCVPHDGLTREAHEAAVSAIIAPLHPDYLVLAKYMRLLSPEFVAAWPRRIVNIHHSFLPAFVGARPYKQAFDRGVKVIGATAHFVTEQIDDGPIIVQQVIPVDHSHTAHDLAQAGRDVERSVLARALKLVLESRVFLSGNRTVIFD